MNDEKNPKKQHFAIFYFMPSLSCLMKEGLVAICGLDTLGFCSGLFSSDD